MTTQIPYRRKLIEVDLPLIDAFGNSRQLALGYMTAWEECFRMAYHLNREDGGGIVGTGMVAREMDGNVESIERLAARNESQQAVTGPDSETQHRYPARVSGDARC